MGKAVKGLLSVPSKRDARRRCGATNGNIAHYNEGENAYVAVVAGDAQASSLLSLRDARLVDEGAATVVFANLYMLSGDEKMPLSLDQKGRHDTASASLVQVTSPPLLLLLRIPILFSTHKDRLRTPAVSQERLPYIEKVLFAGKRSLVVMDDLGDLVVAPTGLSFTPSGGGDSSSSNEGDDTGPQFGSACLFARVYDFDTSFVRPAIAGVDEVAIVCAAQSHGVSIALLLSVCGQPEVHTQQRSDEWVIPGNFNLVSCEWMPSSDENGKRLKALVVASAADGSMKVYLVDFSVVTSGPLLVEKHSCVLLRELLQGPQTACISITSLYCEERQEILFVALSAEQKSGNGVTAPAAAQFALKGKDGHVLCIQGSREEEGSSDELEDKTSCNSFYAGRHAASLASSTLVPSLLVHLERPSFISPRTVPFLLFLTIPCVPLAGDEVETALQAQCIFSLHRFAKEEEDHLKTVLFQSGSPALGTSVSYESTKESMYTLSLFNASTVLTYSLNVPLFGDGPKQHTGGKAVKRVFEVLEHTYVVGACHIGSSAPQDERQQYCPRCLLCRGIYVADGGGTKTAAAATESSALQESSAVVGQLEILQVSNMSVYTAADTVEEVVAPTSPPSIANVNDKLKNCLHGLLQEEMAKMEARLFSRLNELEDKLNLLIALQHPHDN